MEANKLSLFTEMCETLDAQDLIYEKLYEFIAPGIKQQYSQQRIATDGDFLKMAPNGDYCLYVHYPYCDSICKGCRFPRSIDPESMDAYCDSLTAEMDIIKDLPWAKDSRLGSVFFGGGTPSLISEENIEKIMFKMKEVFIKESSVSIVMEVNPQSTTAEKVDLWKHLGINRVSIGAQSFDQRVLEEYRRGHDVNQVLHAVEQVARRGMVYNLDLLYGSKSQTVSAFRADVQRAIDLSAPHITLYPYFFGLPDRNKLRRQLRMYEAGSDLLLSNGYHQYAVFEFARTEEAICQNVMDSFVEPTKDVIGLGAGPFGKNKKLGSYTKYRNVSTYKTCLDKGIPPFFINHEEKHARKVDILLGLYGFKIDRQELQSAYGEDPYLKYRNIFDILAAIGHVQVTEDQIILRRPFRQGMLYTWLWYDAMRVPKDPPVEEILKQNLTPKSIASPRLRPHRETAPISDFENLAI